MIWDQKVEEKFKQLISKLPFFHRHIAEKVVIKKAEDLATQRGSSKVEREDLVKAFLTEVPEVFRNYLAELLKEVELD
jgi:AAA+ superfamily predicted ATPase